MTALTLGQKRVTDQLTVELTALTEADVEALVAVEKLSYSHPWTLGNFRDAFKAGNLAQGLKAGDQWVGYFVAMQVLDEVHLLNITVAPAFQRQGWARCLLQSLSCGRKSIRPTVCGWKFARAMPAHSNSTTRLVFNKWDCEKTITLQAEAAGKQPSSCAWH